MRPYLMLAPLLFVLCGLFGAALGLTLMRSFRYLPAVGLTEPDLSAYTAILTAPGFLESVALSVWIAVGSALLSAALALATALALRQAFVGRGILTGLIQVGLAVPHVVGAVGILYLFSQSGAFARMAFQAGLIDGPGAFPALTNDPYAVGIMLLYVWKEMPFITLILLASLQRIGPDHEAAARSLGATPWQAFAHVLLPMLMPSLLAATALVFAFAFGAYEVPLLLGAHAPEAVAVLAWRSHTDVDLAARPEAMAMAVVIAVIAGGMLVALAQLLGKAGWGGR
ncbi:MAG: hypothetical protein B7Z10_02510 [Rhodobacterales bacterium 32-66-7]|nr:MAG: hypothetical protein B7Z10_02510 [Rhodobacterales bacterium 32-66-7]